MISKKNPHLSNIRDLKKYSTPVKHSWSQKKYPTPVKHSWSQKKYPTPVKHSWSQKKKPYTCQTSAISKKIPPHLTNIRDLKKISHTSQTPAIHGKKKYPTPNKHPQSKFIFTWKFTRKNGEKYVSHLSKGGPFVKRCGPFVKRCGPFVKGWSICQTVRSICQKVRSICQRCPRTPIYLYY